MFDVRPVALTATQSLRNRVLRPGEPDDGRAWVGCDTAGSATFAAFDDDGAAVSTATVLPAPCPWRPDAPSPWRIRGMATDDRWRGRGVGGRVLVAAVDHARAAGATLIWCHARIGAVSLYEQAGFAVEGDEFDLPDIGPHRPMAVLLGPDHAGQAAPR